jgi:hypothetical protein
LPLIPELIARNKIGNEVRDIDAAGFWGVL